MSPELSAKVLKKAETDLLELRHPQHGWSAGLPKYRTLYPCDVAISFKLIAACPPKLIPPWIIESTERAVAMMVKYQGRRFDPDRDEEKGKIFHELHNGHIPPTGFQTEQLRSFKKGEAEPYYGAADADTLFIELVADLARVKEARSTGEGERYVRKLLPNVYVAYMRQTRLADSSGWGLPDSTPQNFRGLFFHSRHDSDFSYLTEEGDTPRPPHLFLTNSLHYVVASKDLAWMAEIVGREKIAAKAWERHQRGREALHRLFWMKDEGYYSPLVDGEQRQVRIITDDAVEGLWLGLFENHFAHQVIERVDEDDMSTEWGIRSRSFRSRQFAMNGPKAYWNGNLWPQDTAKAAFGGESYGAYDFADRQDQRLFNLVLKRGSEETVPVDEDGRLLVYKEGDRKVACNPQLWSAAAGFARSMLRSLSQAGEPFSNLRRR